MSTKDFTSSEYSLEARETVEQWESRIIAAIQSADDQSELDEICQAIEDVAGELAGPEAYDRLYAVVEDVRNSLS